MREIQEYANLNAVAFQHWRAHFDWEITDKNKFRTLCAGTTVFYDCGKKYDFSHN